jgi:hypothetical protein
MTYSPGRWLPFAASIIGVLAMLAGLAILIVRRADGDALPWLLLGAVIFGTSGISGRRGHCWPRRAQ